jgi:hypothetical protein
MPPEYPEISKIGFLNLLLFPVYEADYPLQYKIWGIFIS